MSTILYIHGFNSAGTGAKAESLRKMYPKWKVLTPTFNYKDLKATLKQLNSQFITNRIDVVIGTSMGGFLSLYGAAKHHTGCIAINPVTQPSVTLAKHIGENRNFVTKERYILTEKDLKSYMEFEKKEFSKIEPEDKSTIFLLSEDDEMLGDHHYLEKLYPQCHNFRYFTGYGHRFNGFKPISAAIDEILSQ